MTTTRKNIFNAQCALAIFEEGLLLNTFDKHLKPVIYELVTNLNKRCKIINCHTLIKKLIDECYEIVKKKVDLTLDDINWLNFLTNYKLDDQTKCHIINLSINMPSQEIFYFQNWDSANILQTVI